MKFYSKIALCDRIIKSILDNKDDKTYLLNRYRSLQQQINWFLENMDMSLSTNQIMIKQYQEELVFIKNTI